jgi:hypothetical protein
VNHHSLGIEVSDLEPRDFSTPHSCRVQGHER